MIAETAAAVLNTLTAAQKQKRKRAQPKAKVAKVPKPRKPRKPRAPNSSRAGTNKRRKIDTNSAPNNVEVAAVAVDETPQVQELQTYLTNQSKPLPTWSEESIPGALTTEAKNEIKLLKREYDRSVQRRGELIQSVSKMLGKQYIHELRMILRELNLLADAAQMSIERVGVAIRRMNETPAVVAAEVKIIVEPPATKSAKPKRKGTGKVATTSTTPVPRSKNAIEQEMCRECGTIVNHNHNSRSTCPNPRCGASGTYLANTSLILAFGEEMEYNQNTQEFRKAYRKFLTPFFSDTAKPPQIVIDVVIHGLSFTHAKSVHMVLRARIKSILVKEGYKEWKNFDLWLAKYVKGEYIADIPKATLGDQLINMYHFSHLLWPQVQQPVTGKNGNPAPRNFIQKPPFTNAALNWLGYPELAKGFHKAKGKTDVKPKLQQLHSIFEHFNGQHNKHFMKREQKLLLENKSSHS